MKKIIIAVALALTIGAVGYAKQVKDISIAAGNGVLTGTWVNDDGTPRVYTLDSAFIQIGTAYTGVVTVVATVSSGGTNFTVDTCTITSNTVGAIGFTNAVCVGWGQTCTVTRAEANTNSAMNIMLVIE